MENLNSMMMLILSKFSYKFKAILCKTTFGLFKGTS